MNKYVFFREYYKPICIGSCANDEVAKKDAQRIANEIGESVIVCRHLTMRAVDAAIPPNGEPLSGSNIVPAEQGTTPAPRQ